MLRITPGAEGRDERRPELYDGGVDWEGTLWHPDKPHLLTFLPPALRGDPLAAGYPAASDFLWPYHRQVYWELTQRIYRAELDPEYTGAEADYDYASRPASVRAAVARVGLTGRIGRPLITLHGTLDALLPIGLDSDVSAGMVRDRRPHRYYRVEGGNHVDGLFDAYPDRLRPILPCFREAFTALIAWRDTHRPPPASGTLPRPTTGDLANTCDLATAQR